MPATKPGSIDTGVAVQSIKLAAAAPTAPYVLTAVIPIPPEQFRQQLAVRKAESGGVPTDWFYTETERIGRIHGIDYYEVTAYIDSGTATSFTIDRVDSAALSILEYNLADPASGAVRARQPGMLVNSDAWEVLHGAGGGLRLEFYSPSGSGFPMGRTDRVQLQGSYGVSLTDVIPGQDPNEPSVSPNSERMWRVLGKSNGWYRRGRMRQTFYKHVPVRLGGAMGYLHIFATIQAGTPEIQFAVNWHNAGIEERATSTPGLDPALYDPENPQQVFDDSFTPSSPFGVSRVVDILIHSIRMLGLETLPPAEGVAATWEFTPQLKDGANVSDSSMRPSTLGVLKRISDTDPNRVHAMPITFERCWRFAVHPTGVTPYAKHAYAVADWSRYGGWMFQPIGLPDLTALSASVEAATNMATPDTNSKVALRTLQPWKGDESGTVQGIFSPDPMWPASWDAYGGSTAGTGMTPYVGAKQAWRGNGIDLLFVHQLRDRARTYGALYYNISGLPVIPQFHAPNYSAPWKRFNRRFERNSQGPQDLPFLASRANPRQIHRSDYNPGPQAGATPTDAQAEPVGNRPDWYMPGLGQAPLALNTLVTGFLQLANVNGTTGYVHPPSDLTNIPGSNEPDLAVPVQFQISGANTFDTTKSITFQIIGTGEFDVEVTENVTFAGVGTSPNAPSVQGKLSAGKFKTVRSIEVTNITGTPVSTELLTIGRASVGIADYFGDNGITALDDQHAVRYHAPMKALYLLTGDPIAFVYLMMDAADARMKFWDGSGQAQRLFPVAHGAPGRGNQWSRDFAFDIDRITTGMAISHAIATQQQIDTFYNTWRVNCVNALRNAQMSANGLFQAPNQFKEWQFQPFCAESFDFDPGNSSKFIHGIATRETSYFSSAILQLAYCFGHFEQSMVDLLKGMARGFQDLLWKTSGGTENGPHAYFPVAWRRSATQAPHPRTGALENLIRTINDPIRSDDTWTIFANQAELPEENPLSRCLLNPLSYPAKSTNVYLNALTGNNLVKGTPVTLLRNDINAAQQPTPIILTIGGGATFNNSKRRTFKITGTDPWGVPIDDDCLAADSPGNTMAVGTIPVTAHSWPVATRVGVTILGGNTFVGGFGFTTTQIVTGDAIGIHITGTNSSGQVISENITNRPDSRWPAVIAGTGQSKQFHETFNYFKTVTEIRVTSIQGTLLSTEKFRFGTRQNYFTVLGNGGSTQEHRHWQNFKTVTEIVALTDAEATEIGQSNLGTTVVGETFSFGNPTVGLRQNITGGGPLDADSFQTAYALAAFKFVGATEADELIKRFCNVDGSQGGADTLLAAKNALLAIANAYSAGGTTGASGTPYAQWATLLWTLRDVS